MVEKNLAHQTQLDAATFAAQKFLSQKGFEFIDGARHGGLADRQYAGGAADAILPRHLNKSAQVTQFYAIIIHIIKVIYLAIVRIIHTAIDVSLFLYGGLMQSVKVNSVLLHYQWLPVKKADAIVVFCNPLGTDLRIWDEVKSKLGPNVSTLVYDTRGHGLSELRTVPHSIDDHANDLLKLMDHLKIKRPILCGLSIGGVIVQRAASLRPRSVSALILCDTAPKIGTAETWTQRIATVKQDGLESILDATMARWFTPQFRNPNNPTFVLAKNIFRQQRAAGYLADCAVLRDTDLSAPTAKLKMPALCIVGDQDQTTTPDMMRDLTNSMRNASFKMIADCGHVPCLEKPKMLASAITQFLKSLPTRK